MFGDISDIDVDAAGRIYVFDRQAQNVRLFEGNGAYVRTIGGVGHGPGEFSAVNGIAVDPANRLWILNQGNLRYSVFDTSGALLMEPRRRVGNMRFVRWLSVFTPDGDLYERTGFGLARYDTVAQRIVDTLPQPPFPEGTKLFTGIRTLTAKGWWQGVTTTYRLSRIAFTGDTLRIVGRAREADRLSIAQRDSAKQQQTQMQRRVTRGEYKVETIRRPIFQKLVVDDLDHLWVMLASEAEDENTRFDIFDPIGRYLGELTAPHVVDGFVLPIFRRGTIYYLTKDELDVPYVVVADIMGRQ
jgi:hypothetical protein